MDVSRVSTIENILLCTNTKWKRRIYCPSSWWKVYNSINTSLKKFSGKLFAELESEKDDLDINEVISGFRDFGLDEIPDDVITALSQEMKNVAKSIHVSDEEASSTVGKIIADLDVVLKQYGFIKNNWSTYGSYKTGLCCVDSDIDLFFENIKRTNKFENIPKRIAGCLKKSTNLFSDVHFIESARIPIIKLKNIRTGKECDICFCESGVKSSTLNKFYVQLNPLVKIFTLYLKLLLKKYRLYGTNRMTTHVIFWLVVFFFQQKKLLPPVKDVRKKYADCQEEDLFENWNFSVKQDFSYSFSVESDCLPLMLLEFAKFYSDFDFAKKVISPYLGYAIPIEKYEKWQIPENVLPLRFQRYNSDGKNTFYRHVINLQEPSILSSNLAKNVFVKVLNFFKIFCTELSSSIRRYTVSDGFLMEILPDELPYRNTLPRDLMQYALINLDFGAMNGLNFENSKEYLCRSIHRMVGATLQFELKSKTLEDVYEVEYDRIKSRIIRKIEITKYVVYMNYSSTDNTWNNIDIRKLLLFPNRLHVDAGLGRSVDVYFVGVIDPNEKKARIMIQTDLYLCRFFQKYGSKMLQQTIFS